jgi:DNA mismatch endonuclease, patch repair protein
VFGREQVAVFVDGCFWHGCPKHGTWPRENAKWWREKINTNRKRDRDTDAQLEANGWVTIRIWEHESVEHAAERVRKAVLERRA